MFDFRLQVFYTVARRLNFTKAANELYITQPAVSKHIQEIENYFKTSLFERRGSKIALTEAGKVLMQHCENLFSIYRNLEFEMNTLTQTTSGTLRVGASTTVAQYILPPVLAAFHQKFKEVKLSLTINNTEQIEQALLNKTIDLGISEGQQKNPIIKYEAFVKDEIVLVTKSNNKQFKKQTITAAELTKLPILLREPGSGTLEVIEHALKRINVKISALQKEMQMGNTESIKLYLLNSDCFAFLSIHSILKELKNNEYQIIDVTGLSIERYFNFIKPQGQTESLADLFIHFANSYNFK